MRLHLLYAKRALSPVRLVLKVRLFSAAALYRTGVFRCFCGVLTRLELEVRLELGIKMALVKESKQVFFISKMIMPRKIR